MKITKIFFLLYQRILHLYLKKNKNNDVFNFSISYAGSSIGPYSAIKKFSENASAVFMVYDKQKEESFKELKNTLNDVNENYKDVFKALIVKSADYKENGKK